MAASAALRFRAYGERQYVTLGSASDGWTRTRAEQELQNVLADVRRGIWRPPAPEPAPKPTGDPTFYEFASQWFETNKGEWRPKTRLDYQWQLTWHLLPFFKDHRLSQITIRYHAPLPSRGSSCCSARRSVLLISPRNSTRWSCPSGRRLSASSSPRFFMPAVVVTAGAIRVR